MLRNLSLVAILFISSLLIYPPVIAESPKQLTYIALGDSLTAGLGSTEENHLRIHGFVPQYTKHLREKYTVKVENYGIPGLSSTGLAALLQTDEALRNRIKKADIISLSIGGNDFLQTVRSIPDGEADALNLRMEILQRAYQEIYSSIQKLNSEASILLVGLYNPYPKGHELHDLGAEYVPLINLMGEEYESNNTHFINPYDVFLNREEELTHIEKEDTHPNDAGYQEIVTLMKKVF